MGSHIRAHNQQTIRAVDMPLCPIIISDTIYLASALKNQEESSDFTIGSPLENCHVIAGDCTKGSPSTSVPLVYLRHAMGCFPRLKVVIN
ncbi:hypothetical protein PHYBLDRAFT_153670 [Phycomyces blakesleeanus NRRL 1555(-)]|uniref:Uncharacterized protein n=1 Tax=Phycomyces blakesleeanus (strain ATCC 8743b / DSM 1359 / FGSC 10004 / NBRC 33097 / NRRL 1555) TaxID=763407 RepID=A0A167J6H7_PHYB8|nr:hypothetical protein PHYBLDRAFT_153670 [Phycomyces blakesleeanus NRRL 1555(-)]OAD65278.1 hypothetical protein PHYBLDRAFT_153670 [Phycomyces blakesleeanus NRRL 1555(-)]|eukprot:XP_018283318.1 hypothetical protein PHYBLDRAFT_153670 [Phycomyces blakesleeanus NRRL 1555(-)]